MSEEYQGLTVTFDGNLREDQVNDIVKAITQIRGVLSVSAHVSDLNSHMAYERARHDLGEKLWRVLYPKYDVK